MGLENMMKNKKMEKSEPIQDAKKETVSKERHTTLGRPRTKTENEKIINIAVPMSVYEKMNLAKLQYNNNLTRYINTLIEQDLAENLDKYKEKLLNI